MNNDQLLLTFAKHVFVNIFKDLMTCWWSVYYLYLKIKKQVFFEKFSTKIFHKTCIKTPVPKSLLLT